MDLLNPSIGLVVWMTISFLVLLFVLRKFAWKPILTALHERESGIEKALQSDKEAELRMAQLTADNEALLMEARKERDQLLKEARAAKDAIVQEAKEQAKEQAAQLLAQARETIKNEQARVVTDLRNQVAQFSVEIAERILKEKLEEGGQHHKVVEQALNEMSLN
jgi:F-type H+-transporting ATPase subunit b